MEELERVQLSLKIPIEKIIDFGTYIEVYSSGVNIGEVPYIITEGSIKKYDTDISITNNFSWLSVYRNYSEILKEQVSKLLQIPENNFIIALGTFRNLYVQDLEGNFISTIHCFYENNCWIVRK
ncbi:hypothetical protein [Chryseobacterium sp. Leaf394]|uniref:hypothetical protein n=1 Tax=Chryseobacterium sp. Leaf394 TaxID=1736361 RepID=UPI000FF89FFD|nr:hypothetical protein [Chryseobacterium sp. Leaf394]